MKNLLLKWLVRPVMAFMAIYFLLSVLYTSGRQEVVKEPIKPKKIPNRPEWVKALEEQDPPTKFANAQEFKAALKRRQSDFNLGLSTLNKSELEQQKYLTQVLRDFFHDFNNWQFYIRLSGFFPGLDSSKLPKIPEDERSLGAMMGTIQHCLIIADAVERMPEFMKKLITSDLNWPTYVRQAIRFARASNLIDAHDKEKLAQARRALVPQFEYQAEEALERFYPWQF